MIRAEPSLDRDSKDVWYGRYCTGRFWHTVRHDDGRAVGFNSEQEAIVAARNERLIHLHTSPRRARDDVEAEHMAARYAG